jgi:hypothetical protein
MNVRHDRCPCCKEGYINELQLRARPKPGRHNAGVQPVRRMRISCLRAAQETATYPIEEILL